MDADIDALERELDFAKRRPLWAEMQRIYAEQLPVLPLFFGSRGACLAALAAGRGADRPQPGHQPVGRDLARRMT